MIDITPPSEQEWTEGDRQWFDRVRSLEAKIERLTEALTGMMQLVEHGVLVRDTSRDTETGWALHQLPLLITLQKAQAALVKQGTPCK